MNAESSRVVGYLVSGLGIVLLLVELPFAAASGLMAPLWAVVLVLLGWLVLFVLAVRWFRTRPWPVLALPFIGAVLWFAVLTFGEQVLGWTA
jgi:hypothetical protein